MESTPTPTTPSASSLSMVGVCHSSLPMAWSPVTRGVATCSVASSAEPSRYGRRLGLQEPFLTKVASIAIQRFQGAYPELLENRDHIIRVIGLEEERFAQTFERGFGILSDLIESRRGLQNGAHRVSGQETFNLYDTYGFPRN